MIISITNPKLVELLTRRIENYEDSTILKIESKEKEELFLWFSKDDFSLEAKEGFRYIIIAKEGKLTLEGEKWRNKFNGTFPNSIQQA